MSQTILLQNHLVMCLFVFSACCAWRTAEGHGFLLQPMSRTFVSYKFDPPEQRDYNPQGANAGGKQRVYDNGRLHWPNGRFGLCGDAYDAQVRKNERPGRITASYSPGSTIYIHLVITANHWGRMEFRICPYGTTAADAQQRCTVLQRADGKGPHWTLPPGELPDPQGRPLIPAYTDASFSYYIYPENDDFRATPVYVVRYKLPPGFTCQACVLSWYWLTGNSCNPPCEAADPLYPNCNRLAMGYCGDSRALSPEEFWGCSDIHVGPQRSAPHINATLDRLSDRLRSALEAQDREGRQEAPARPNKADYWRAELLEQAEALHAAYNISRPAGLPVPTAEPVPTGPDGAYNISRPLPAEETVPVRTGGEPVPVPTGGPGPADNTAVSTGINPVATGQPTVPTVVPVPAELPLSEGVSTPVQASSPSQPVGGVVNDPAGSAVQASLPIEGSVAAAGAGTQSP